MDPRTLPAPRLIATLLLTLALVALPGAAYAHGDRERAERFRAAYADDARAVGAPRLASDNVALVANQPGSAGISGCFTKTKPLFVMSSLDSIKVFDVRKPRQPRLVGTLPSAMFENEAMNCGERRTSSGTKRFALVGVDLYQASPDDIEHVNAGEGNELVVVDVTDPTKPRVASRVASTTSTHTVSCVQETDCRYAYSAGNGTSFSVFDLTTLSRPREVDADPRRAGVQPFTSPTAGHKWNFDAAGLGTHTGFGGSGIFDARRPAQPRLLATTGAAGRGTDPRYPGYNDFIHHNSFRPNAKAFKPNAAPSVRNGNVLFVTEEDYEQVDCTKAGSFQTWWVKRLDKGKDAVVPLDKVELSDLGTYPLPVGAFCSAHWFSYHPSGVVAAGFYGGGLQLVDVRNPRDLKSYGHAFWGASEVWDAYWVPAYDTQGRQTTRPTNLVYSVDLVRGLDVYAVGLPGTRTSGAAALAGAPDGGWTAPVLPVGLTLAAMVGALVLRRRVRTPALT